MGLYWYRLQDGGVYNEALKKRVLQASGAYAIRDRRTKSVQYVGESDRGCMWKTLLRHFQAPDSFLKARETGVFTRKQPDGVFYGAPAHYDIAVHVTSHGPRPREKTKRAAALKKQGKRVRHEADQAAMKKQAEWIARLKPALNMDDGLARDDAAELRALRARQEAEDLDDPFRVSSSNPRGRAPKLVELGKLTCIAFRREPVRVGKAWRNPSFLTWRLRDAPVLAYDAKGRLSIVYTGAVVEPADGPAKRDYRRTHWGAEGAGEVREGGCAPPPFVVLGRGLSITYTTKKGGDRELVDYVHDWGEGARGKFEPPIIEVHRCATKSGCSAKCAARGAIRLSGGTYRVDTRGIVG